MSTTSGVKHDAEKPDMSLLSSIAMVKISEIMTFGKRKYSANNWRGGIAYSRLLAATLRHVFAYLGGQSTDPETGKSHLAHASCCLMMMLEFEETRPDLDDRYKGAPTSVPERSLPNTPDPFAVGDLIVPQHGGEVFTVAGFFYDKELKQVMFIQDGNGRLYQADSSLYKTYEGELR